MSDRIFGALLKLLPAEFRGDYGREIETAFRDERREARGIGAIANLWLHAFADILATAPSEHWDILKRDARFAFRTAMARPAHTATAIFTLALGLGASVVMFSVVDGVLLAPLPYREPGRLVTLQETSRQDGGSNVGYLTFVDLKDRSRSLESIGAISQSFATLTGDGLDAEQVSAMRSSASYFHLIGVAPAMGRAFTDAEDRPGVARRVAILTDSLWRRRFRADPSILGKPITVNGNPFVVVGVMPQGFEDLVGQRLFNRAEMWVPLGYDPAASFACRTCRHLVLVARLADGVDPAAAQKELTSVIAGVAAEHPNDYNEPGMRVVRLADLLVGPVRTTLSILSAGVLALLLVACFTVANLLLLRASDRTREIAVRAALGVSPGRMARQLITESLLLALTGGVAGLLPAMAAIRMLATRGPSQLPRLEHIAIDTRAMFMGLLLVVVSGVLFGLAPMRQWLTNNLAAHIHGAGRSTSGSWRVRAGLVAANVALAAILLVGSGLLVRSLFLLLSVQPGFDPSNTLTLSVTVSGPEYQDDDNAKAIAKTAAFYDRFLERVRALPGVASAAGVTTLPLGGGLDGFGLHLAARPLDNPETAPSADRFVVTGDYFRAIGTPLRRGRLLDARDDQTAPKVAVVNERLAREMFPGEDALGQQIMLGPPTADRRTIVGVVGDVNHRGLDVAANLQVYVPHAQWAWAENGLTLLVRSSGDPAALIAPIRRVLRELDPRQPMTAVKTYSDVVAASTGARRLAAWLLSFFAASALALAIIGLYGAVSVLVGQQQREIGVRFVLGAGVNEIRGLVLRRGLQPVFAGLAGGFIAASLTVALLETLLFGVRPRDPATFAVAFAVLMSSAVVACALPAWRASRTDPATILRTE